MALIDKAEKLLNDRRYEEALAVYEEAIRLSGRDPNPHLYYGKATVLERLYEEALAIYEEAIRLSGHDPNPRLYYGKAAVLERLAEQAYKTAEQHGGYGEDKPPSEMSLSDLVKCSTREMKKYRQKEAHDDQYVLEILQRAVTLRDNHAWSVLRQQFHKNLTLWMRYHPQRDAAIRYQTEESYVDDAFTRFWKAVSDRTQDFSSLAGALRYLHLCLNCAIMDTLRAYSRPMEEPLPDPGHPQELETEDHYLEGELWEVLNSLLPDEKEKRMAYLHFHCNLKPREIVHHYPNEFSSEAEVYRLKRNIMHRIMRSRDKIRWKLGGSEN